MSALDPTVALFLQLAKIQAVMSRRFDGGLGGLGFSEFIILFHLSQAEDGALRRVDLAEKLGLTASGVTRMLLPMERVGLVRREANEHDARVSLVVLAPGGKRKLAETLERAEEVAHDAIPAGKTSLVNSLARSLNELGGVIR